MAGIAPPPEQHPGHRGNSTRDWSSLPDPALLCISRLLPTFVDHLSFAATCSAWYSVAKAARSSFMASQPPLICNVSRLYSPLQDKYYTSRLLAVPGRRDTRVLNFCHGHYVVQDGFSITYKYHDIKLRLVHSPCGAPAPAIPEFRAYGLSWVVLTASPGSPNCVVVACCQTLHETIAYRRLGAGDGVDAGSWHFRWYPRDEELLHPAASGGKVYAWSQTRWAIIILEFLPHGQLRETAVGAHCPERLLVLKVFPRYLAASDTGVWLVELYVSAREKGNRVRGKAVVYHLDEPERRLKRMSSLGGRALLVAERGCAVVSDQPGQWGGEGDKVYVYSSSLGGIIAMDYTEGSSADYLVRSMDAPLWPGSTSSPSFWALLNMTCS